MTMKEASRCVYIAWNFRLRLHTESDLILSGMQFCIKLKTSFKAKQEEQRELESLEVNKMSCDVRLQKSVHPVIQDSKFKQCFD